MDEFDTVVKRRQGSRHIRELDTYGLLLRFGQIEKYITEYLRSVKHYKGPIEIIDFGPVNATEVFGVLHVYSVETSKFGKVRIFSKVRINNFLNAMLEDFGGVLPPVGLVFVAPGMNLRNMTENEERFQNPRLFKRAPFAGKEQTRFCTFLLPLVCNPVFKGRAVACQHNFAAMRGLEVLTAVEISYCLVAIEGLLGRFYPYIPEWLATRSKMEVIENGGVRKEKIVLVGDNCSNWKHSHGNKPGIRFSTSCGESSMSTGAAVAMVKIFSEEDVVFAESAE